MFGVSSESMATGDEGNLGAGSRGHKDTASGQSVSGGSCCEAGHVYTCVRARHACGDARTTKSAWWRARARGGGYHGGGRDIPR